MQSGDDDASRVITVESTGCDLLGCGVHREVGDREQPADRQVRTDPPCIYYVYAVTVPDKNVPITLQPGETVDSKFIPFEAFLQAAHSEEYVLWCVESCEMQLRGYADAIR